jgi:Uma2 family endonuclease
MTAELQSTGIHKRFRAIIDSLPESVTAQVIAGSLVVMSRPGPAHIYAASALDRRIGSLFQDEDEGPGGWWILPEPELTLGVDADFDPVVPDLAGWRREHMPQPPETPTFSMVPEWVCEVLSPRTRKYDRDDKMPFYARAGASHGWIVDPEAHTLEAYVREGDGFRLVETYAGEVRVRVPPFEAVELNLAKLWMPRRSSLPR